MKLDYLQKRLSHTNFWYGFIFVCFFNLQSSLNKNGYRRVLDWLRSGTVDISGLSTIEIELLLREARYFQISSLVFELEHVLEERRVFVLYTEEKKKKKSQ